MLRRCLGSVIIRIGLQNRFQNFKQRDSKSIQIGSVVFVAIFSWRRAQKKLVVSYKRKYVHELLVNRLFKPAQEKVWLGEMTVPQ